jgi:hypothetical protein
MGLVVPLTVINLIKAAFLNHNPGLRVDCQLEYYATSNQVGNFESPGTGLLHVN